MLQISILEIFFLSEKEEYSFLTAVQVALIDTM